MSCYSIGMSKAAPRLFNQFQPDNYKLALALDKAKLEFSGTVTITGKKVGRPSKRITLHQKDLHVHKATVTRHSKSSNEPVVVSRINTHNTANEVRIHSDQLLHAGTYTVTVEFKGRISKTMLGIYPSYFTDKNEEKTILATQFESHHAREAFPCIDEPEAKATFDLTLTTDKNDVVLGNTPSLKETTDKTHKTVAFETTPRMSTYLLAFVSGPMHYVEGKTKDGIVVRSWSSTARPKKELQYSMEEGVRVLDFFTEYFGTNYPLSKCDQVALPDFDAGAMENWGLITYREIALLTDPDNPSISSEQYISLVVAHELSHQWFGNLVTMKWWDDLWLNESFASLMEHLALDAIHPDWHQWELYTATDVISSSNRDIYKDIQSVGVTVTDPDLLGTLFDPGIVYAKGGRLLKMLREYIGDDAFRQGLKDYFQKHAYTNTTREDLWAVMSKASGKDISGLMTPWIVQSGMPVVSVEQTGKQLQLSQKRYVLDADNDTSIWPIPLLADQKISIDLLSKKQHGATAQTEECVVLNQYGSGHYFTHYAEDAHRAHLAKRLADKELATETSIILLNDSLMLARDGIGSLADTLKLVERCGSQDRDSVWAIVGRVIGSASQLTEGDDVTEDRIKLLRRTIAKEWYEKLGWDDRKGDDPNTKQLRHTALAFMLSGEDEEAISEALRRYESAKDIANLDAELRGSILSTAVRHGEAKVADDLLGQYETAAPDVQLDIVGALSSTKDAKVADKILAAALGKNGFVRAQDVLRWVALFMRSCYTRTSAWEFITKNWKWLEETLGHGKSFDYLPTYCASVMNSKEWEKKYHQLFDKHLDNKLLSRNIQVGFSDVAARVAWRERDEQKIKAFFTSYK